MVTSRRPLLQNQYWFLRHGRSIPNSSGVIVSALSNGVMQANGLAPAGILQAVSAGELFLNQFLDSGISPEKIRIYSSPFSRTRQTEEAVTAVLLENGLYPTVKFMEDLRERFFGPPLELQSHDHYSKIWKIDSEDPLSAPEGGESAADVAARVIRALLTIETEVQGHAIIIVSHGDPLQILQSVITYALKKSSSESRSPQIRLEEAMNSTNLQLHRSFSMLTGEIRHFTMLTEKLY